MFSYLLNSTWQQHSINHIGYCLHIIIRWEDIDTIFFSFHFSLAPFSINDHRHPPNDSLLLLSLPMKNKHFVNRFLLSFFSSLFLDHIIHFSSKFSCRCRYRTCLFCCSRASTWSSIERHSGDEKTYEHRSFHYCFDGTIRIVDCWLHNG